MKIKTINDMHGYFLTEEQYNALIEVEIEGKKQYYMPTKWKRGRCMDKALVEELVRTLDDKSEIIKKLDCTLLQLNNFLNRNYGYMNLDRVRTQLPPV